MPKLLFLIISLYVTATSSVRAEDYVAPRVLQYLSVCIENRTLYEIKVESYWFKDSYRKIEHLTDSEFSNALMRIGDSSIESDGYAILAIEHDHYAYFRNGKWQREPTEISPKWAMIDLYGRRNYKQQIFAKPLIQTANSPSEERLVREEGFIGSSIYKQGCKNSTASLSYQITDAYGKMVVSQL